MKCSQEKPRLIIILVLVIGLMLGIAYRETTSTRYSMLFLSKDSAMFIDALHASPNKIIVRYPQKTEGFNFRIADSKVTVYGNDTASVGGIVDQIVGESFPYTSEKDIVFQPLPADYTGEYGLILTKTNTKLIQD